MLRWRLLLGSIFIAAVVALCYFDHRSAIPGLWLAPLALLLTIAGSKEVLWLLASRDLRPLPWVVYLGSVLIVASAIAPHWLGASNPDAWFLMAFPLTFMLAFGGEMGRYEQPSHTIVNVALTVFALAYVGLMMGVIVALRFLLTGSAGLVPLISLIAIVKMGDIGAYTVGRLFGKNKMAPVLSPGKTLEGAGGAIAFAVLVAALVLHGLLPAMASEPIRIPWWSSLVFGVTIGIAGMLGDLAESLFKRDMGRKDSSDWMPGFGGVLDIIDSLLIAAPVAYACWLLVPVM